MPYYDLYCQKCKKDFSLTMSIKGYEKKNFSCPHCKGKEIRRVPSAFIAKTSRKS
ncbi:MAG: zinc ribbon domain-containing protein [Deltaproteobacteria bacterium]|nr:zinc ribbon domain-containing protein [Deltaproteobacteria bacterium]